MRVRHLLLSVVVVLAPVLGSAGAATVATNERPLAEAGLDRSVEWGTPVYLDARGSRDPDGEIVGYEWTITAPNGSTTAPRCPTCARTAFRPTRSGEYAVTVEVTDDDGATATDTLYVTVGNADPPSVEVSGPGSVEAGTTHTYAARIERGDASLSRIRWTLDGTAVDGGPVDGPGTVSVPVTPSSPGRHVLEVTVVDAAGHRVTDEVPIRVREPPDDGPAGGGDGDDTDGDENTGSGGDGIGPDGPQGGGDGPDGTPPGGDGPDGTPPGGDGPDGTPPGGPDGTPPGGDGSGGSSGNTPPVARFGVPDSVPAGTTVTLDGSAARDPDGRIVEYRWTVDGTPAGDAATVRQRLASPGEHRVTLRVTDDDGASATNTTTVEVTATGGDGSGATEKPPTARIDAPSTVPVARPIVFDGSDSSDPDGTIETYRWSFGDGGKTTGSRTLYPFLSPGTYAVSLTVVDDDGNANTARTTVEVTTPTLQPVATVDVGGSRAVGERIALDGTGSYDPDGGGIRSFSWGGDVDGAGSTAAFTPTGPGTYEVVLTVEDDDGERASTTVEIDIPPPNRPPTPRIDAPTSASIGERIAFDGGRSSDPDGDPLTYEWSIPGVGKSTGSVATHTFGSTGTYEVSLTVSDGTDARTTTHRIDVDCGGCSGGADRSGDGSVEFEVSGPDQFTAVFDGDSGTARNWNYDPNRATFTLDRYVNWAHWKLIDPRADEGRGRTVWERNVTGGGQVVVPLNAVGDLHSYDSLFLSVTAEANDADTGTDHRGTDSYRIGVCTIVGSSGGANCASEPSLPDPGVDVDGPYSLDYGERGQLRPTMKNEKLYEEEGYRWESLNFAEYAVGRYERDDEVLDVQRGWDPKEDEPSVNVTFQLTTQADFRDGKLDVEGDKQGEFTATHEVTFSAIDGDNDGVPNKLDNCPNIDNNEQLDIDNDGKGNKCDKDSNSSDGSADEGESNGSGNGDGNSSGGSEGGGSDDPCNVSGRISTGCGIPWSQTGEYRFNSLNKISMEYSRRYSLGIH